MSHIANRLYRARAALHLLIRHRQPQAVVAGQSAVGGSHPTAMAADVALACRVLGRARATHGSFGHVSARLDDGSVLIRSRGGTEVPFDRTSPDNVISVSPEGRVLHAVGGAQPPNEVHIHLGVYRSRPDVRAVVHVHPRSVVALTAAGREILALYGAYDPAGLRLARRMSSYSSSELIRTPELGDKVAAALGDAEVCVLHGHGVVVVAEDVAGAVLSTLALLELAEANLLAWQLTDNPVAISDADITAFDNFASSDQAALSRAAAAAAWANLAAGDARMT